MSSWGSILAYYRNGVAKILCPFCNHEFLINTRYYRLSKVEKQRKLKEFSK